MINVLEMLEGSAKAHPGKTAFADPKEEITFGELLIQAKRAATLFLGKNLTREGTRSVVFYMEKCTAAMPLIFGGVYCNAFYSFIDVRQSDERVLDIIERVDPTILITDEANKDRLDGILKDSREYLLREDLTAAITKDNATIDEDALQRQRQRFHSRLPLYVNFTSGSTGTPKGVVVSHGSVIDFTEVFVRTFGIRSDDVISNQAPFDFDVSVKDVYSGLFTGATVRLIPREYFTNPTMLMDFICDGGTTVIIWAVTAMCFVSIMNGFGYRNPDTLRLIMFSGEVMPVKQLMKWQANIPDATYINLYGPTEITCNCTYHILDRDYAADESIPIGIPFENEKVFLLDENDCLVTDPGKEGEICVAGDCLALGYFKDKEKTDRAFVQNPLNKDYIEMIYRTGDLGRYDEAGLMHYTSRKDFQIKHMGQRIELTDIEVSVMAIDGVTRACCLYDEKKKKIVLYYTGDTEKGELIEKLRQKLPEFMIPGKSERLPELPVNKNGKIDRNALKAMM